MEPHGYTHGSIEIPVFAFGYDALRAASRRSMNLPRASPRISAKADKKTTKDAFNQRLTFVVDFFWFNAASYDTLIGQASA
jgi:hypothetical protein